MYQHKHKYVYEYLIKRRSPDRGYERCMYTLLTDISGGSNIKNKHIVENTLRITMNVVPRMIRFCFEENNIIK